MPKVSSFLTNLRSDMPLAQKVQRLIANNWIKIRTHRDWNHGEPGC